MAAANASTSRRFQPGHARLERRNQEVVQPAGEVANGETHQQQRFKTDTVLGYLDPLKAVLHSGQRVSKPHCAGIYIVSGLADPIEPVRRFADVAVH
ncbi:hypothetical protein [Salinispora arenicola]|uniref:hypothetical protein n=1 Tax=Salinispora arenicola TaxID=168697 RepID=UPI0027DB51B2|nr:hypothetical protein [Salinispora arenicola]